MRAAEWRYVLEVKALCLKNLHSHNLMAIGGGAITRKMAWEAQQTLINAIERTDPIFMSLPIYDYIRDKTTSINFRAKVGNMGKRGGDFGEEKYVEFSPSQLEDIYAESIVSSKYPVCADISHGLLVLPTTVAVMNKNSIIGVRAIYFVHTPHTEPDMTGGMRLALFLDPKVTTLYAGMPDDQLYCYSPTPWLPNTRFRDMVRAVAQDHRKDSMGLVTDYLGDGVVSSMAYAIMVGTIDYLNTTVDAVHRPEPEKQERSIARKLKVSPSIKVIRWRKEVDTEPRSSGEPGKIDWSCQWEVRPHTRTYHRGTDKEFTIQISPYRKGPADKPFRKKDTVHVLVR